MKFNYLSISSDIYNEIQLHLRLQREREGVGLTTGDGTSVDTLCPGLQSLMPIVDLKASTRTPRGACHHRDEPEEASSAQAMDGR